MDLNFVDPPTKYRREKTYDWDAILAALKDNPGQWALLAEQGKMSTYNAITQNKISNFRPGLGVEARLANSDWKSKPRRADVFVRYSPDLDESLTVKERQAIWVKIRKREKENK